MAENFRNKQWFKKMSQECKDEICKKFDIDEKTLRKCGRETEDGHIVIKVYHRTRVVGFSTKYIAKEIDGTTEKYNLDGKKYRGTDTWYDLTMEAPKTTRPRDSKGRFVKVAH